MVHCTRTREKRNTRDIILSDYIYEMKMMNSNAKKRRNRERRRKHDIFESRKDITTKMKKYDQ